MGNKKSLICCLGIDKNTYREQESPNSPRRQLNNQTTQSIILVYLDRNIVEDNLTQLQQVVTDVNTFNNVEECIRFIENFTDKKICIISSGTLGQHLVPRVHNLSQVDSIFLSCVNKKYHGQWAKDWSKIKGVFTEILPICEAVKQVIDQCDRDMISISFVSTDDDFNEKSLDEIDAMFMYCQILKEILSNLKFTEDEFTKYIDYCRRIYSENEVKLKKLDQLQEDYQRQTPVWWYTSDSFLSPMLNDALRLMNIDIIMKMGFFIHDLHFHIERLHFEQYDGDNSNEIFTVYRGQSMSKTNFEQMMKTQGGLMSFNNFLLTSKDYNVSLDSARRVLPHENMIGILFIVTIDPTNSTTTTATFASIANVNYYSDKEDQVLFSLRTVFRIVDIKSMDENPSLFQVNLTLPNDNDNDLRVLTNRIHEETFPHEKGWQRLGLLFNRIGQSDKAQEMFEILLEQTRDDIEKGRIYDELGLAKYNQKEYQTALTFYTKSLQIRQVSLPENHPDLCISYSNLGNTYREMGNYDKAISSYENSFEIREKLLPSNHPDLVLSYNSFGLMHFNRGEYSKAYSFYERAVNVAQQLYPSNHPLLELCIKNLENTKSKLT